MPTLTVPRNATELEEMLGDDQRRAQILQTPDTLRDFIVDYASDQQRTDPGIADQIRDETQRQFAEILRGDQIDAINRLNLAPDGTPVARPKHYNKRAPGAKLDEAKLFDGWVDYLSNMWTKATSQRSFEAKTEVSKIMNALGSGSGADGGFLIPETLRSELLKVSLETAMVRPLARVVPMESLTVPFPTIDSVTNAGSVYGGVTAYWTEEAGQLNDSSPTFGRVVLTAKKLTLYSEIPNELFMDALPALEAFMGDAYPEALAFFEDVAFISGNGAGQPLGFLNAPAAVEVPAETGQSSGTIVWENVVKMFARMLPSSISRAVWIAHIDTFPQLATMALAVGTGGSAVWIGNGNGAGAPPVTILGRPVLFTEKVSTAGTSGDLNFVDLGYYLIGDRQEMQVATSADYQFKNDKTAMRVIERVDGQPWIKSAIAPQTGTNSLTPFVKTATR